ncbi:MAG: hypothetical protein P0Y52_04030 [Candidatus Brevundimonas phytovorans]|nr:hypothetical protein [Brevundimonas sp.]WEK58707.1 MAG: hypothetical protein P0Y52_04030 [Brevundimonas sp.]
MSIPSDTPAPARTRRSSELWALVRADYLAGGSAPEVCERHGLSLSTFRHRARVEGWRRADQVETPVDAPFVYEREYDPGDWRNFAEELDRPAPVEGMRPPAAYPHASPPGSPNAHPADYEVHDGFCARPPRISPAAPPHPDFDLQGPSEVLLEAYATPTELADVAWLNAEQAIRAGRMIEARGWTRIHRDLAATSRPSAETRVAHARADLLRVEKEKRKERARLQDLQHQVALAKQAADAP